MSFFYDDPTLEADLERALAEPDNGLMPRYLLEQMLNSVRETKARTKRLPETLAKAPEPDDDTITFQIHRGDA